MRIVHNSNPVSHKSFVIRPSKNKQTQKTIEELVKILKTPTDEFCAGKKISPVHWLEKRGLHLFIRENIDNPNLAEVSLADEIKNYDPKTNQADKVYIIDDNYGGHICSYLSTDQYSPMQIKRAADVYNNHLSSFRKISLKGLACLAAILGTYFGVYYFGEKPSQSGIQEKQENAIETVTDTTSNEKDVLPVEVKTDEKLRK